MKLRSRLPLSFGNLVDHLRTSWWFVPGLCVLVAVALSIVVLHIDSAIEQDVTAWYMFKGGPEAARELLATIATSMMTITGVVFSVTVLVLQLASNQFSPRVLRTFLKDRRSQLSLGIFLGTFVYALLGLRKTRGAGEEFEPHVPSLTVWFAVVLAVICVGTFVIFIHHVAQSIRAVVVIRRIGDETRAALDELYPEGLGEESDHVPELAGTEVTFEIPHLGAPGVLASVSLERLERAASDARVMLRVVPHLGDFVARGSLLFRVCGAPQKLDVDAALSAMSIRRERAVEDDAAFGIRELVDLAERVLSPSFNDPSTAVQVLDELHDILRRLTRRRFPASVRYAADGRLVLVVPHLDYDGFVRLALDEIRHYGGSSLQVLRRLRELVIDLLRIAPPGRRTELEAQLALVDETVERNMPNARDRLLALEPTLQG